MPQLLQQTEDWAGFSPVKAHRIREADAARLVNFLANTDRLPAYRHRYEMERLMRGHAQLSEVITTSTFPSLFGFTLERAMIARYRAATTDWRSYCAVGTMPNFNQGEAHKVQGNDSLLPRVNEKAEYRVAPVVDGHYHRRVYKWGRQFDISWEAMINDSMNAFGDVPARMADAVTYTRAYNCTDLYVSAAGPDALLFGVALADIADLQLITNLGALPLTILNLEATMELMAAQTDVQGRPLNIRGVHLVVPTTLEFTARQILTSATKMWIDQAGGAGPVPYPTNNIIAQVGIQLHVDPLINVIDLSQNQNTWYLFAEPSQGRAIQMDFLRGHEDPEICMKASDKVTTAGALISPFAGDFATDNIFYRVREVHGGTRLDRRYCYAQVSA
ncbi:MAG: Mu-like prophage major head subunit gpT family protein [Dehalococcoidia bacterium]